MKKATGGIIKNPVPIMADNGNYLPNSMLEKMRRSGSTGIHIVPIDPEEARRIVERMGKYFNRRSGAANI